MTLHNIFYVLDTNVLIHDPTAVWNFDEHHVVIPMTVLEELDNLKSGRGAVAADCRHAIREIDRILGSAAPQTVEKGVPILRPSRKDPQGLLSVVMGETPVDKQILPPHLNDNKILNAVACLKHGHEKQRVVLVTKDINMRLKARACGIDAEDYHTDQLIDDIGDLNKGYLHFGNNFWQEVELVETRQTPNGETLHILPRSQRLQDVCPNQFVTDDSGFIARVVEVTDDHVTLRHLDRQKLMSLDVWGLAPRDLYQAMALDLLLDPDVHLVNLTGSAGSGKTILALAAAIELTLNAKSFRRIIVTRSTQGLDEDIGFLPGTEAEKMEPWLGAITDNLEALHWDDENCVGSIEYVLDRVPLQFKSLNYIRGRSFQHSLILIDESQNLTPHQIKTIVTRAGTGSKVVCLGNLAQIDTPYLTPVSSGLTYLTERFRLFPYGGTVQLQGVPRSALAAFAEENL
ncbi:PhoH family protein [Pseudohongiella spirulinae]|uniref:Putative ATPase related to phosphate starvation-inducible protein PhoH n=1 Tax=Pseudohongiella spirulinae TaxID=1249552 RepID=A0A0S2KFE0_9GAMM|nr:PhoH family protein [Pseudohongiella spirulinae]ALO46756.1 putative ATPase related to phosphate starvation-inducible protein PhoH [Pseudohongiella spirulinae]